MLKCNHSFEVTTNNNNELKRWHFKLGKGRSLSSQKMSCSLKIFQYFFTWSLCSRKAVSSSCHPDTGTSVYCTWSHWNKACKEATAVSKGEGKQPLLQRYTKLWFDSIKIFKIKTSEMTNLHELWEYNSPDSSAITHGNECNKSRLNLPPSPSSNPFTGAQGMHIFSYVQSAVIMNQDLLGVFYRHIMHQHLKQQEEEHAAETTK